MTLFKVVIGNIFKNRIRTTLIVLSVFFSFFIFGFVVALSKFLANQNLSGQYSERLLVESRYQLPLKWSMLDQLRRFNGVDPESVTGYTPLGGYLGQPDKQFNQRALNLDGFLKLQEKYLKFNAEDLDGLRNDRRGALVGRAIAEQFNIKKGDTITLISSSQVRKDGEAWVFNIHGIFDPKMDGVRTKYMIFHDQYLIEGVGDYRDVFWFELNVKENFELAAVAKEVDAYFKSSTLATSSQSYASVLNKISSQAGDFFLMAKLILAASFFTLFLVVGSSIYRSIRERIVDTAVLKTLGFKNRTLSSMVLKETLMLSLLGGIPSLVILYFVDDIPFVHKMFPGLYVEASTILYSLCGMLIFALLICVYPMRLIMKSSIVDSLKGSSK